MSPKKRLIQKSHDTRNNGRVGDVEDVPLIAEGVEREEVSHGAIKDAIDGVADGAADDDPDSGSGQQRSRPREPNGEADGGRKSEENQRPAAKLAPLSSAVHS